MRYLFRRIGTKFTSDTVMVYGNVDEVELVLNGKTIRRKKVQNISETLTLHPGVTIENNQRMEVKHPALWSPDEPNLYVLSTEVVENGKVVDKEETRIGIRHI